MKKTLALSILSLFLLLTGCTTNDGNIGIWFGTWSLESVTIDGADVPLTDNYYVQFQADVVKVSCPGEYHERFNAFYGSWEETDNTMTWLFPDPAMPLLPFPGLTRENHFTIAKKTSKKVVLTTPTTTYTLTKLY